MKEQQGGYMIYIKHLEEKFPIKDLNLNKYLNYENYAQYDDFQPIR